MLLYKLSDKDILEILAIFANKNLNSDLKGTFELEFNDDDGVDIYFYPHGDESN